jgi:signal transduction histidine kinase
MLRTTPRRDKIQKVWPAGIAVAALLYMLWVRLSPALMVHEPIGCLLVLIAHTATVLVILRTAREAQIKDVQRFWQHLGSGIALWAFGDGIRVVASVFQWPLGIPSVTNFLQFAGYLTILAALARDPTYRPESFGRLRAYLDIFILGLSVLALCWLVLIRPVVDIGLAGSIQSFWIFFAPAFDMVFMLYAIRLAWTGASERNRSAFRWLILGFFFVAASNVLNAYRLLQLSDSARGFIEGGWLIASIAFVLAARAGIQPAVLIAPSDGIPSADRKRWGERLEPLLPLFFTYAVVGYTAIDWSLSNAVDWVGVVAASILSLLLVARQGVIAGQFETRQYIALVDASADLAFICQPDGTLRLGNPALYHALGQLERLDEPLKLSNFVVAEMPLEEIIAQSLEGGWTGEALFRRGDETTFPVSLSLRPVRDRSRLQALLAATAYDLSMIRLREDDLRNALREVADARQALETLNVELETKVADRTSELETTVAELARLNEDLKSLDKLKSEFVALVSHELRAPLTNIRTGIELILRDEPGLPHPVNEALGLVQSETARLTRFVETILDLSALEAGRLRLQCVALELAPVASRVTARFTQEQGGDRIQAAVPDDLPSLKADERFLESVLYHLIDNAIKYAPEGEVRLEAWEEGSKIFLAVSDHGPGISEEQREQVFEMFHRLDARDSREIYGYGLGLPMVQRLLDAMDGGIRIEGREGGGARLVLWLPRAV